MLYSICRFHFGVPEKKENFQRYFSDKMSKAWKEEPERLWRKKEFKPFTDYIELSRFALSEDDLKVMPFCCNYLTVISELFLLV